MAAPPSLWMHLFPAPYSPALFFILFMFFSPCFSIYLLLCFPCLFDNSLSLIWSLCLIFLYYLFSQLTFMMVFPTLNIIFNLPLLYSISQCRSHCVFVPSGLFDDYLHKDGQYGSALDNNARLQLRAATAIKSTPSSPRKRQEQGFQTDGTHTTEEAGKADNISDRPIHFFWVKYVEICTQGHWCYSESFKVNH